MDIQFLFKTTNNRIKALSSKSNFENIREKKDIDSDSSRIVKKYFTIPYFYKISKKFQIHYKKIRFQHKLINQWIVWTISLKQAKTKSKKEEHSNVVYKINCHDCNYVGQTKRKLKTLKEYINDLKKPINSLSVISRHKFDHDHDTIDWKNVSILENILL